MFKKLLTILLLVPLSSYAQFYSPGYWTLDVNASSSSFLSDLGGKNAIGTNDFSDLDLNQTRYAFGLGFTYQTGGIMSVEISSLYTRLAADDAHTTSSRSRRQLSVFTDVVEGDIKLNFTVPSRIPLIGNFYVGVGGGVIYYEPKADFEGTTYKLRPLGTEGQNYLPGRVQYSKFSPVIPFSIGKKFVFKNGSSLSLELNMRKTFTDYLDDVSTEYADPSQIAEKAGTVAAALADRADRKYEVGHRRGDKTDNDNFFLFGFKYSIPLTPARNHNTSCSFNNSWLSRKGKTRFKRRGRYRRRIF